MAQESKRSPGGKSHHHDQSHNHHVDLIVRCPHCGNLVLVPKEMQHGVPSRPPSSTSSAPQAAPLSSTDRAERIAEMGRLLTDGDKAGAIKVYRETFGVGQAEAQDAIDKLATTVGTPGAFDLHPSPDVPNTMAGATTSTATGSIHKIPRWGWAAGLGVIAILIALWAAYSANSGDNRFAAAVRRLVAVPTSAPTVTPVPPPTYAPLATPVPPPTPAPTSTPRFGDPSILVGCTGPGRGCFDNAQSIGVDGAGKIYVSDISDLAGTRIEVFDPTGEFITQWKIGDKGTDLRRIAVDRQGTVYVVSDGNIYRYEGATGKLLGQVEYDGGQGFQDVAVTPDGGLVASWNRDWQGGMFVNFDESQDDIVVFDSAGKVMNVIHQALSKLGGGNPELETEITVDRQGNIYATGLLNPAIYKFTRDGKFVAKLSEGQVDHAAALAVDAQGRIYAASFGEILIFAPDGQYLGRDDWNPHDMVFNDQNELLILRDTEVIKFVLNW